MKTMLENPAVKEAGKEEAERIGWCDQCGEEIYEGYQHGVYEGTLFCSESCFHVWIGFEVVC